MAQQAVSLALPPEGCLQCPQHSHCPRPPRPLLQSLQSAGLDPDDPLPSYMLQVNSLLLGRPVILLSPALRPARLPLLQHICGVCCWVLAQVHFFPCLILCSARLPTTPPPQHATWPNPPRTRHLALQPAPDTPSPPWVAGGCADLQDPGPGLPPLPPGDTPPPRTSAIFHSWLALRDPSPQMDPRVASPSTNPQFEPGCP